MKPIVFLLAFAIFTNITHANTKLNLTKEQVKTIDGIFSDWDKPDSPGCGIGIIKDGKLIYARGYGMANLEYNIPNSSKSVFRIGSTSKQFTAASIVLLVEQGKLRLDDTLDKFFPAFPNYAKKITIRHLLNHTSGIRDYLRLSSLKGLGEYEFYTGGDVMALLVNQEELNFIPGEEHLYSNSGYWLLGQIVNEIANMNMAEFADKEIFGPLGMTSTHFHNDHTLIVKNRASGYVPNDKNGYQISMTTLDMIGDGGVFTTIDDIKKWDDAYYNSKVLSKEFWNIMTQQGTLNNGDVLNYASGLDISYYKGLKTISHRGAFVGFRADFIRFPEQRFTVAVFANRGDANPTRMGYEVADIFLNNKYSIENKTVSTHSSEQKKAVKVTVLDFKSMEGTYQLQPGFDFTVSIENNALHVLQHWNDSAYEITKVENNTFHIKDNNEITFTFSKLKHNQTQIATVNQRGKITTSNRKAEIDTSKINIADYVGKFYSKELDVNYTLATDNGILTASIDDGETFKLTLSDIDVYTYRGVIFRFNRVKHRISGFIMNAGRVKNLQFQSMSDS